MITKSLVLAVISLAASYKLTAQSSYADSIIVVDGDDVEDVEVWADASEPATCPTTTTIYSTFGGTTVDSIASYPNTAHTDQQKPAAASLSYTWKREVIHDGEQRGGNCGVIIDTTIIWPISFAITYTENVSAISDQYGDCPQLNACTNTTSPQCPIASIKEALTGYVPCHPYHETLVPVVNSICISGISTPSAGGGICTVKQN
jgi:hypothetical protein